MNIFSLLEKILTISDQMLDLATEACKHHLEEKTQYPTSNMGSIPTSASDSESTTSGLSTPKREGFTVRFHVYAPLILSPEEVLEDFEIGIVSSLHDWSVSDMDPMESKRYSILKSYLILYVPMCQI